jgi:phosphoenolpyruvate phosphomutase
VKVILLNSGIGSRLGYLTHNNPKCLIKINKNETILDYQLKKIIRSNLKDIIITTGPFKEKIKKFINLKYPRLNIQYIHNPIYHKTNYIYTIYLTKDFIDDEIILLHGDLIFSNNLLRDILESQDDNCVLVNKDISAPEKDFKALIIGDKIIKIGVNISGPNCSFLAPLYKLSYNFFNAWLNQIEKFVEANLLEVYAEDALNTILDKLSLKPFYFNNKICKEIDDFDDLTLVRKLLRKIKKN